MAKQLVNPIERHVEKIVLGIAGFLLIGVVVKYVFTSPNKIELGQEPVTPSAIDEKLAQKANEILERIRNAHPQEVKHDPLYDDFLAALAPLKGEALPLAVAPGPAVPLIDSPEGVAGRAALVKVQRPEKPAFTRGRNTMLVKNAQGADTRKETDWVTLSVVFDVKAQSDLQRKTWGATKSEVVVLPPEVERRKLRSDDNWQAIKSWPAFSVPAPPTIRLFSEGDKIVAPKDDQKAFEKYEADLLEPLVQLGIMRPYPPAIAEDGNPWRFPIISTFEDVLKQDDEFLHPKDSPSASPDDRYGLKQTEQPKVIKAVKTPAEGLAQDLDNAKKILENARKSRSKNDATSVFNTAQEIAANRDATSDIKEKAERLKKEADLLIQDLTHGGGGPPPHRSKIPAANLSKPSPRGTGCPVNRSGRMTGRPTA